MTARDAEYVSVIVDALDAHLDWTGPPWNIALAEAKRDYYRVARTILSCLHQAGYEIVPGSPGSGWENLATSLTPTQELLNDRTVSS